MSAQPHTVRSAARCTAEMSKLIVFVALHAHTSILYIGPQYSYAPSFERSVRNSECFLAAVLRRPRTKLRHTSLGGCGAGFPLVLSV